MVASVRARRRNKSQRNQFVNGLVRSAWVRWAGRGFWFPFIFEDWAERRARLGVRWRAEGGAAPLLPSQKILVGKGGRSARHGWIHFCVAKCAQHSCLAPTLCRTRSGKSLQ